MSEIKKEKRPWSRIEIVGLVIFIVSMVILFVQPSIIGDMFNRMFERSYPIAVSLYLTSKVMPAIIISVTVGRILERLGFTDILMRIFVPIMKYIGVNASIAVPAIYNILGDVNAAGRISAPIIKQSGATKDEQKIAIATIMQGPSSFSILVFGITALAVANVNVFIVFLLSLFLPVVATPFILRLTIWRDTKPIELAEVPSFTPDKPILTTIYAGAREGAEVLFLLIIPACCVVFAGIGILDYFGIWPSIENAIKAVLAVLNIEPTSGMYSILAGGTLGMIELNKIIAETPAALAVGSFILASSSPLQVIFGQIPIIWAGPTDLSEGECIIAAGVGFVIRLLTAAGFACIYLLIG